MFKNILNNIKNNSIMLKDNWKKFSSKLNFFRSKMVKIQKLPTGQLVITIPKILAEYEGLKRGMELEFKKHKNGFILEILNKRGDKNWKLKI